MIRSFIAILCLTTSVSASEININNRTHTLSVVADDSFTKTYSVAIGKKQHKTTGVFTVISKQINPCWTPTPNMISHGTSSRTICGPRSPLGARIIKLSGPENYLGIHGTNNENSVGKSASHDCFRMHRNDVIELYDHIEIGTRVIVK